MNNFNVEDYRQPSDTDFHWELKKEFIEMYKYIFDKEKLLCLSQAYCDIVLKKSRYPDPVIKIISELSKPLKMCERFLENNGNSTVKRPINEHQKDSEEVNSIYNHFERPFKQMKFLGNEEQANSPFLSTSAALQPSVQHLRKNYPLPLCNEQSANTFLKSDPILKTPLEHSEKSFKQINFSANERQTIAASLKTSTDRLYPSVELFSNTYNEQGAQYLSRPQQTFKATAEYSKKSFKQANFYDGNRHLNQTILSTVTDMFFPLLEQFRNISSVFLSNEQDAQSLSKSEQVFKAPIEDAERPFKQMDFWANKEQSTSTFLPSLTTTLQPSVEQFKDTYFISSYNEKSFLNLSKSEQTLKVSIEDSERPQKQTILSTTKELLSSALSSTLTSLQSSEEQFTNIHSVPLSNDQEVPILSKSEKTVKTSHFSGKRKLKYRYQIKDIFISKEKEDTIIKALGLPFIKKFAGAAESHAQKCLTAIEIINYASVRCHCYREYHFEIGSDPDIPFKFYSKFILKGCLIASETSDIKKKAKMLCAETAVNTLVKLATGRSSFRSNLMENHKHSVNEITDSKKVFEMFSRNINKASNEPALVTLKNIASLLGMEDYLAFNITSNVISETETEYTCKFFLNDILVSYTTDESIQNAKYVAAELGMIKLANFAEYEIHNNELKKILSNKNKSVHSVISDSSKANNNLEKNFILNEALFYASKRDGIIYLQRDRNKFTVKKLFRDLIYGSAVFCGKDLFLKDENPTSNLTYAKCLVYIGGKEIGVGIAFSKTLARSIACTRAYINLKRNYYSLRLKDECIEGFLVTRDQVLSHEPYSKNVIKRGSIRLMKLKHKCWCLDISDKDLTDCVEASSNDTEYEPENKQKILDLYLFRACLEAMFQRFKESEDYCDILFSDDFTKVEQGNIIRMVKKMGLRSQLLIYKDSKLVCVRHKYDIPKLLDYLLKNGGSSCKFEMLDESETVI